jgi:hypothetical protein
MLKRERPGGAGAAFAYATAVRVFPAILLAGPAVLAVRGLLRGERPFWALRLGAAFAIMLSLCIGAGSLTGRGPAAWSEFARNLELHRQTWATTRVGLDVLVAYAPLAVQTALESRSLPRFPAPRPSENQRRLRESRGVALALKTICIAWIGVALWGASLSEGAVLGMMLMFVLTTSGSYYWVWLCAAPLALRPRASLAALALGPILYGFMLLYPEQEFRHMRSVWMSLGIAALFVSWVGPAARRTLRGRPGAHAGLR